MRTRLTALCIALLPLVCQASDGYFTPPQGWEVIDVKALAPEVDFMARGKTVNMFASTMNVTSEETDLSIDAYMHEVESLYNEPGKVVTNLGHLQTKSGPMRILQIEEKLPWVELRILQGILVKDHVAYVLTATTEEAQFPGLIATLFESMKSFSIKGP